MKKSEAANNLENHKPIHQRTENLLRIREDKIREKKADMAYNKKLEEIRESWRQKIEEVKAKYGRQQARKFVMDLAPTKGERD